MHGLVAGERGLQDALPAGKSRQLLLEEVHRRRGEDRFQHRKLAAALRSVYRCSQPRRCGQYGPDPSGRHLEPRTGHRLAHYGPGHGKRLCQH